MVNCCVQDRPDGHYQGHSRLVGNFDVVSIPRSEQGDDLSGLLADCGSAEVEAQADESYELIDIPRHHTLSLDAAN